MPNTTSLPVAIIGAGPIGLAAAAHLHARGEAFVILEAGSAVGASLRQWSHVQVFSPWRYLIDEAARELLASTEWSAPDLEGYPTGGEIVSAYLEPLAATGPIEAALRLNTRVTSVSRMGFDKLKSAGREAAPFVLTLARNGQEDVLLALGPRPTRSGPVAHPPRVSGRPAIASCTAFRMPTVLIATATPASGSWSWAAATAPSTRFSR
jgi:monoamine oxidase